MTTTTKITNTPKKYSFLDLEKQWVKAGGSTYLAPIMAAIAEAESGGNPGATSPRNKDGSIDRGLWQINSSHGYGTSSFNPSQNAKQAVSIYNTQGLNAWTTFKTGAYLKFLPASFDKAAAQRYLKAHPTKGSLNVSSTDYIAALGSSAFGGSGPGLGSKVNQDVIQPVTGGVEGALLLVAKEAMYALTILGGGMLVLLGLLFIGADIGLGGLSRSKPVQVIQRVTPTRSRRTGSEQVRVETGGNLPGPEA